MKMIKETKLLQNQNHVMKKVLLFMELLLATKLTYFTMNTKRKTLEMGDLMMLPLWMKLILCSLMKKLAKLYCRPHLQDFMISFFRCEFYGKQFICIILWKREKNLFCSYKERQKVRLLRVKSTKLWRLSSMKSDKSLKMRSFLFGVNNL